jgi:hypothetical protein
MKPEMNLSELHYMILNHIIQKGFAPESQTIAAYFGINDLQVVKSKLIELENYHGVVLHPNKEQIWIIHPFSIAPTNFVIETDTNLYWGNCAWCSLGAAALLQPKRVTITTSIGAEAEQVKIEIKDGRVSPLNLFVHFPVPITNAWDNVVYTCSVMLFFIMASRSKNGATGITSPKAMCNRLNVYGSLPRPGTATIFREAGKSGPVGKPLPYSDPTGLQVQPGNLQINALFCKSIGFIHDPQIMIAYASIRAVDLRLQISKSCSGPSSVRNRSRSPSYPRNRLSCETLSGRFQLLKW